MNYLSFRRLAFTDNEIGLLRIGLPYSTNNIEFTPHPWMLSIYHLGTYAGSITKSRETTGRVRYTRSPVIAHSSHEGPSTNKMYKVNSYCIEDAKEELVDYLRTLIFFHDETLKENGVDYTIRPSKYNR